MVSLGIFGKAGECLKVCNLKFQALLQYKYAVYDNNLHNRMISLNGYWYSINSKGSAILGNILQNLARKSANYTCYECKISFKEFSVQKYMFIRLHELFILSMHLPTHSSVPGYLQCRLLSYLVSK